jgi:hypothetical protein
MAVWKAKRTTDEPKRLVWMCGEVRWATTMPDNPKWLVWHWKDKRTPDEPKRGSSGYVAN